jgi:hypothetical protein
VIPLLYVFAHLEENTMDGFTITMVIELVFYKQDAIPVSRCEETNSFSDESKIRIRTSKSIKVEYFILQCSIIKIR